MSELKAYTFSNMEGRGLAEYYLKSEADKAIDDLEESHKKEVGQLLIEIAELKNEIEKQKRLRDMALASVPNVLKVMKIIQHHKYKRCLAMARIAQDDWHLHNSFYAMGHQEFEKRKCEFYEKWRNCWLAIAEKFKEEK